VLVEELVWPERGMQSAIPHGDAIVTPVGRVSEFEYSSHRRPKRRRWFVALADDRARARMSARSLGTPIS